MVRLINARLAPWGHTLRTRQISREEFVRILRDAAERGDLRSYIGYENTSAHIGRISGYVPVICREETPVQTGDVLLCCVLKSRVKDPRQKAGAQLGLNDADYEYGAIQVLE